MARSTTPSFVAAAESAAASSAVSARRASPPASRTMWSSASGSRVTAAFRPRSSATARRTSVRTSSSVSERSCSTSERDSSGETTEKNGFSVVAATSSTIRSSTAPSRASCWVREKRWTSSMNSTVDSPEWVSRRRASSMTRADLLDARGQRGQRHEPPADRARHEHGERRLAGAGRAVEQQRRRRGALDQPAQRRAGAEQVVLAEHLAQVGGPHAHGERRVGGDPRAAAGVPCLLRRTVEQLQVVHVRDATRRDRQRLRSPRAARGRVPSADRAEPTPVPHHVCEHLLPRPVPADLGRYG